MAAVSKRSILRWGDYPGLSGWTLKAITSVLITEAPWMMTQRQRGEDSVTTKAEMGVMEPPAKQGLQPPEAGRARKGWSPRSASGSIALRSKRTVKE